jgi:hypothetical protein
MGRTGTVFASEGGVMDVEAFVRTVTIYGRAAFLLCIGEQMLQSLVEEPGYPLAQQAFGEAVRWLASGKFVGDILSDQLLSESDEGILIYQQECEKENAVNAYICLEGVLAYVAWHSYTLSGELVGALVSDVTEYTVGDTLDLAKPVLTFDPKYTQEVYDHLTERYRILHGDEVGMPITFEDIRGQVRP